MNTNSAAPKIVEYRVWFAVYEINNITLLFSLTSLPVKKDFSNTRRVKQTLEATQRSASCYYNVNYIRKIDRKKHNIRNDDCKYFMIFHIFLNPDPSPLPCSKQTDHAVSGVLVFTRYVKIGQTGLVTIHYRHMIINPLKNYESRTGKLNGKSLVCIMRIIALVQVHYSI